MVQSVEHAKRRGRGRDDGERVRATVGESGKDDFGNWKMEHAKMRKAFGNGPARIIMPHKIHVYVLRYFNEYSSENTFT
jgi:hypothetical protein